MATTIKRNPWASICALLAAAALILVVALSVNGVTTAGPAQAAPPKTAQPDKLGDFNSADYPDAPKLSTDTLTPEGSRGACWPSNTFNVAGGDTDAVTYLQGNDPRDKNDTYKTVVERDEAWLSANRDYYQYTPGQTDADWHKGLVLKQLTYPITVLDTYCPDGQMNIRQWEVQTLQVGEWVFFMKGHAPGDGTDIKPVRKANCGNFLLPPPKQTTITKKPPTKTHKPPTKTYKPPKCKYNCGHKPPPKCKHNCTPPPKVCVKPPYPGQGWEYNAKTCTYYKPPQTKPCMLNGGPNCPPNGGNQPVQDNTTSGKNTGKTPGAGTEPDPSPKGSTPKAGTKAPDPTDHGTDSGASDGSGTPGGSTSDSSGTTGGGSSPGSGPTDSTHSGDQSGTDGQTSTGGGVISNPFG